MSKKHCTFTIEEKLFREFKELCMKQDVTYSRAVEGLIRNEVEMTDSPNLSLSRIQNMISDLAKVAGVVTKVKEESSEGEF